MKFLLKPAVALVYVSVGTLLITLLDHWVTPGIYPHFMSKTVATESKFALTTFRQFSLEQNSETGRYDFLEFKRKFKPELGRTSIGVNPKCFPGKIVNSLSDSPDLNPKKSAVILAIHQKFFEELPCPQPGQLQLYSISSMQRYNSLWSYGFTIGSEGKVVPVEVNTNSASPAVKTLIAIAFLVAVIMPFINLYFFRRRKNLWFLFLPNCILAIGLAYSLWTCLAHWSSWLRV